VFIYLINPSLIRTLVQLFMNYDSTSIQGIAIWHWRFFIVLLKPRVDGSVLFTFLQYNVCV